MRSLSVALTVVLLLAACTPRESPETVVWMFYTGSDFLEIETTSQNGVQSREQYIAGVSDGLNTLASLRSQYAWMIECSLDKSPRELSENFERWLRLHPERLGEAAPLLYLDALREACTPQVT